MFKFISKLNLFCINKSEVAVDPTNAHLYAYEINKDRSIVIIVGVYTVIWGIFKERKDSEAKSISSPLLQNNLDDEDTMLQAP